MSIFNQEERPGDTPLAGRRVAILATNGFEHSELEEPRRALEEVGAEVKIVSIESGNIRGWKHGDWGSKVDVDLTVEGTTSEHFDALVLPGGVINPDKLRMDRGAVQFVRGFIESGKPIAAICHGPWTLIDAGGVRGRTLTSWPSIKLDLENAGAHWIDSMVVCDHGLVTSRKPDDLPAFCRKMIEEFKEGRHILDRLHRQHSSQMPGPKLDPSIQH